MRFIARLRARADVTYDTSYHYKCRGRIWRALRDTKYDELHDKPVPLGLCFSNPFPWGDMEEGDQRNILVSATDEEMLAHVAKDFANNPDLNIGEMPFEIESVDPAPVDVGEPGTRGVITTHTGVCIRFSPGECEMYGIDSRFDEADTYWQPEHTMGPFIEAVTSNLQYKHERFGADYVPGPIEADHDLFEGYELIKTFAIPVTVTTGVTTTMVLSKWNFPYEVQNDTHRKHLNLLLDTGIGEKNGYGFGFCNIKEGGPNDYTPATETATTHASASGD